MNNSKLNPTAAFIVVVLALLVIFLAVFALVFTGRETDRVVTFIGPSVIVLIGLAKVLIDGERTKDAVQEQQRKLDEVKADTETVVHATNGKLDARFAEVHERLDAAGIPPSNNVTTSD